MGLDGLIVGPRDYLGIGLAKVSFQLQILKSLIGDRSLESRVNSYRSWTQLVSITTFKEGGGEVSNKALLV